MQSTEGHPPGHRDAQEGGEQICAWLPEPAVHRLTPLRTACAWRGDRFALSRSFARGAPAQPTSNVGASLPTLATGSRLLRVLSATSPFPPTSRSSPVSPCRLSNTAFSLTGLSFGLDAHFPPWRPSPPSWRLSSRAASTVKCAASPRQALGCLLQSSLYSLCFTALDVTVFITPSPQINC